MGDFFLQRGEARIVEQRRQPWIEARRADPGGAILAGAVERGEGFVLLTESGVDRGEVHLVHVAPLREGIQISKDLSGAIALTNMHVADRQLKIWPNE